MTADMKSLEAAGIDKLHSPPEDWEYQPHAQPQKWRVRAAAFRGLIRGQREGSPLQGPLVDHGYLL